MKLFSTILIDPPWPQPSGRRQVDKRTERFPKVSLADIEKFPIDGLAAPNAHLYVWVTNVQQFEKTAFRMIRKSGFTFRNRIVWVKITKKGTPLMSLGPWFRFATEYLFFATRGNLPAGSHSLPNVMLATRGRTGEKPRESYELVQRMSPVPWLEVFARRRMPGWKVWGNESGGDDIHIDWIPDRAMSSRGGVYLDERGLWRR